MKTRKAAAMEEESQQTLQHPNKIFKGENQGGVQMETGIGSSDGAVQEAEPLETGDHPESPKRPSERAIRCGGGYIRPGWISKNEIRARVRRQHKRVAAAGLKYINDEMASQGKPQYELVMVHKSACFRGQRRLMFHGNFVAKLSDDPNAENRLFFVECKIITKGECTVLNYADLGAVDIDPGSGPRSCKRCDALGMSTPICHPPRSRIRHSCKYCDAFKPKAPNFHPSGFSVKHLSNLA